MRQFLFLLSLWCCILKICKAFSAASPPTQPNVIPITVISGFLGSGKTTLLKTLLENKEGLKIAVIVNDVASVNIDSKLISESNKADGMVELQNGCACCSLSDELLGSVSELVTMSDLRGGYGEADGFDHIVVELTGVADPKRVRSQFQEAIFYDMPLMERVRLDTMITVVDCSVFLKYLQSTKTANRTETPELFYQESDKIPEPQYDDDWMEDLPPPLLQALMGGEEKAASFSPNPEENKPVAQLLISQAETADVVILNKVDLVDDTNDILKIEEIVAAVNARAKVIQSTFGNVSLDEVLAVAGGSGVAEAGIVDDHRDAIKAAEQAKLQIGRSSTGGHIHEHESSHASSDQSNSEKCEDSHCTDESHSHSHAHSESSREDSDYSEICEDRESLDTSHIHSHLHSHGFHDNHNIAEVCMDPQCTDESHSHSHSHSHEPSLAQATTLEGLGIGSFLYRARKPFHPQRLVAFLRYLPLSRGLPVKTGDEPSLKVSEVAMKALQRVVRSKGFVWLGDSNVAANYWSHSGTAFELQCLGRWWSTLGRPEWPPEATVTILADFDDPNHDENSNHSVGDRRQEVVFIGSGLMGSHQQDAIRSCLDQCLLDEKEWEEYRTKKADESSLQNAFVNLFAPKMLTY